MKRILALAGLLAMLAGPALADPTVLPVTGLSGTCYASGAQPAFISYPTVPLNMAFSVQANFKPGSPATAVGNITLTRSTDGGVTFAPITAGQNTPSRMSPTTGSTVGGLTVASGDGTTQFRLECSLTSGQISWSVAPTPASAGGGYADGSYGLMTIGLPVSSYVRTRNQTTWSAAQMQPLYEAKFTPISASDLASLTTGYTTGYFVRTNPDGSHTRDTAYVKLSLASSNQRDFGQPLFKYGEWRQLRAQSATVVSIVDGAGNPVVSANVGMEPSLAVTSGATVSVPCYSKNAGNVTPNDFTRCYTPSSTSVSTVVWQGASQNGNDSIGIPFFPTLSEAIDSSFLTQPNIDGPVPGKYPPLAPNLTALGL